MKNRFRNPLAALASLVAAVGGLAMAGPPPIGRTLPDAVQHCDASAVLVVSGTCLHTSTFTLVDRDWVAGGSDVQSLQTVDDGAIVNDGTTDALVVSLSGSAVYRLEPGESMVVGTEASAGYVRGCVCKCGNGWVFVSDADCGGSNCLCNGQGPCIDPTDHQLVEAGFSNCKRGWGPGLTTE